MENDAAEGRLMFVKIQNPEYSNDLALLFQVRENLELPLLSDADELVGTVKTDLGKFTEEQRSRLRQFAGPYGNVLLKAMKARNDNLV